VLSFGGLWDVPLVEGSKDEVGQVIAGMKFGSFLTADMASKS